MNNICNKREKEKTIVKEMIELYCRNNHNTKKNSLCPDCEDLFEYAKLRIERCPFMEEKSFCSNCHVHCYNPVMREKIRSVMRYSGPRMLFHHPVMAIHHIISSKMEKIRLKKND